MDIGCYWMFIIMSSFQHRPNPDPRTETATSHMYHTPCAMVGGAFFRIAHPYLISARSSGATPNCLIASLRSFNFRPRATYRRHFTSSQFLSISPSSLSKTQVGRQYDVELDDETNEKDITEEVVSYEEPLPLAGEDSARSERSSSDATKVSLIACPPDQPAQSSCSSATACLYQKAESTTRQAAIRGDTGARAQGAICSR